MAERSPDADRLHPDLLETEALANERPSPSGGLRERLLASLRPATRLEGFVARLATFLDLAPERARELVRSVEHVREASWVDDRVAGVRLLHFEGGPRHAGSDCGLVYLEPGARYPRHRHPGDEWALVLSGRAVEEETGHVWLPGDLIHNAAASTHAYRVEGDAPFVFAVVLRDGVEILE